LPRPQPRPRPKSPDKHDASGVAPDGKPEELAAWPAVERDAMDGMDGRTVWTGWTRWTTLPQRLRRCRDRREAHEPGGVPFPNDTKGVEFKPRARPIKHLHRRFFWTTPKVSNLS